MSQLPTAESSSHHPDPTAAPVAEPGFEVKIQAFWNGNRGFILIVCALVILAIVGREGWQYFSAMREKTLREEYAQISDKPDRLALFADANAGHPLAGVAYLQIADQKFENGDFKDASSAYTKAAGALKNEALVGRAKIGAAISLISSGDNAGGESALKAINADQTQSKAVRAEAAYHLAALALEAGRTDEVKKLVEDITKIDLGGPWSQRAVMLIGNLPDNARTTAPTAGFSVKP